MWPPMTLVAVRFLLSGSILLLGAIALGARLPRGRELALTALYGVVILGLGNGALVLAETWIPSGMAALIITVSPFWMVGLNALLPPREPLHGPTLAGMLIGLLGVGLLVGPGALAGGAAGAAMIQGALVLQAGCASWSLGSLLQKRLPAKAHPIVAGASSNWPPGWPSFPWRCCFRARSTFLHADSLPSSTWSPSDPSSAIRATSSRWSGCPWPWSRCTTM